VLGTGLVGTFVARALEEQGSTVVAADLAPSRGYFTRFGPNVGTPLLTVDILDGTAIRSVLEGYGIRCVVLTAGLNGAASAADVSSARRVNVEGPCLVAREALAAGVHRLVYLSSFAVYGKPAVDRLTEDLPLTPETEYGRMKAAAEAALNQCCSNKLDLVVLRPCGVYGPVSQPTRAGHAAHLFSRVLAQAVSGQLVLRAPAGAGDEYLYVKDLGRAIALIARCTLPNDVRVFNVGSGSLTTAKDILKAIETLIPAAQLRLEQDECRPERSRAPLDIARLRRAVAFEPRFSITAGLRDQVLELMRT
jgi:nucleoside-diphosphate-sugar epimerase